MTATPGVSEPPIRLTRVHIRNFRCIRDLTIELDDMTVLIGENNSGKTAVLKAIQLSLSAWRSGNSRVFGEYDYHLPSSDAEPEDADPIRIDLTFAEPLPGSMPLELREDLGEILFRRRDGHRVIRLRVKSQFDADHADFVTEAHFLDSAGELMRRAGRAQMNALRRAVPVHFLSALRDVQRHFRDKGPFWREFLSASDLRESERKKFEAELTALNRDLIAAHPPLREVRQRLNRARDVIGFDRSDPVSVDALPGRASALLSQARVNVAAHGGAAIPLDRQGEGVQSLAVLLLFEAALRRSLAAESSAPHALTILEEPEAHLHPSAVRSLVDTLEDLPGQKILSTHSGDLVAALDPGVIRRLAHRDGAVRGYRANMAAIDRKDRDTFDRKIRRGRGELLFARCWLLYEGESEAVLFRGVAERCGVSLAREGVVGVQASEITPRALFRIGNQFGIPWYLVYDGDKGTKKYGVARECLDGAKEDDRMICPYRNLEAFLQEQGFADVYRKDVNKVVAAQKVVTRMVEGVTLVPKPLKAIVEKAVELARA